MQVCKCMKVVASMGCGVGDLHCGGVAVLGTCGAVWWCGMGELRCQWVAVWEDYTMSELRCL